MPPCRHTSVAPAPTPRRCDWQSPRGPDRRARRDGRDCAAPWRTRKTCTVGANVGVVDIPIDDVGDGVADPRRAQCVRRPAHRREVRPARLEKRHDVRLTRPLARSKPIEDARDLRRRCRASHQCAQPAISAAPLSPQAPTILPRQPRRIHLPQQRARRSAGSIHLVLSSRPRASARAGLHRQIAVLGPPDISLREIPG